ncbi:hypothetical protein AB0I54_32510 [Streptomyces sp. NPDC050625]|uniref:hypothetical protein n=1 Tax=Streptomyces sp. NPDC050625 TaxID=3154629 RepID=UPI0034298778
MLASKVSVTAAYGFARARRVLLPLTAVGMLFASAACDGGGGGWQAPGKGQVAVLLDGRHSDALNLLLGGDVKGLTTAADGTVYAMLDGIQRIKSDRTVQSLRPNLTNGTSGLVALPDGSLVFGKDHTVQKFGRDQQVSVLAGVSGKTRSATAQVPKSATAADFRFGDQAVTPVGVRPDGSLIVLDGDVVWSLANGRLTRVYEVPAADRKTRELVSYPAAAVDRKGTVYVTSGPPARTSKFAHLADVMAISPDGSAAPVALPRSIAGVKAQPGDLTVNALTGDDADGIYINAYDHKAEYVLHLHAGRADMVARSLYSRQTSAYPDVCNLKHPVDAEKVPCDLPWPMTYRDGKLVLGGKDKYFLEIGTK